MVSFCQEGYLPRRRFDKNRPSSTKHMVYLRFMWINIVIMLGEKYGEGSDADMTQPYLKQLKIISKHLPAKYIKFDVTAENSGGGVICQVSIALRVKCGAVARGIIGRSQACTQ